MEREIIDEPVPFSFHHFCQKIKQKDSQLPSTLLHKASTVFNKFHGLKKNEKNHRIDIDDMVETKHQWLQVNNHVKKCYKKIDETAFENLELILEIIDYYQNKK